MNTGLPQSEPMDAGSEVAHMEDCFEQWWAEKYGETVNPAVKMVAAVAFCNGWLQGHERGSSMTLARANAKINDVFSTVSKDQQ